MKELTLEELSLIRNNMVDTIDLLMNAVNKTLPDGVGLIIAKPNETSSVGSKQGKYVSVGVVLNKSKAPKGLVKEANKLIKKLKNETNR